MEWSEKVGLTSVDCSAVCHRAAIRVIISKKYCRGKYSVGYALQAPCWGRRATNSDSFVWSSFEQIQPWRCCNLSKHVVYPPYDTFFFVDVHPESLRLVSTLITASLPGTTKRTFFFSVIVTATFLGNLWNTQHLSMKCFTHLKWAGGREQKYKTY